MDDFVLGAVDEIRSRYQAAAHPGLRGGQMDRQFNAGRAEAFREALVIVLARALHRQPSREEIAAWLAGQSPLPIDAPAVLSSPSLPEPSAHRAQSEDLTETAGAAIHA